MSNSLRSPVMRYALCVMRWERTTHHAPRTTHYAPRTRLPGGQLLC